MQHLINFLTAGIIATAPLLFGVLGEILTEKSGNLNLGVQGMMFMGGIGGLLGAYFYEQAAAQPSAFLVVLIAMACAMLTALLGALIFSVITISLRANQTVTGLALSIFGVGFGNYFGEAVASLSPTGILAVGSVTKDAFNKAIFPDALVGLPYVGKLLFSHNFMVYLALALALLLWLFLKKTRAGLNLRAVGESPATADAAGVNVSLYKYLATCIGGAICGLGGLYLVMNAASGVGGAWVHNCIDGYGWLAVALVIFSTWSPSRAILAALVFGCLSVMRYYYSIQAIPATLYDITPYIATVVVLVAVSMRHNRKNQPPASLGLAYFREER